MRFHLRKLIQYFELKRIEGLSKDYLFAPICGTSTERDRWSTRRFRRLIAPRSPSSSRRTKVSAVAFVDGPARNHRLTHNTSSYHSVMSDVRVDASIGTQNKRIRDEINMLD